ncbi:hypothetical protein HED60_15130 [Planctomycetales bacterium ZRK34]|nr:hypothetical protein HED60_15130 [Planctomycetales bacterium ZRK34]
MVTSETVVTPEVDWSAKHGRARRRLKARIRFLHDEGAARGVAAQRMIRILLKQKRAMTAVRLRAYEHERHAQQARVDRYRRVFETYYRAWRRDEIYTAGDGRRGNHDPVSEEKTL